MGCRYRAVEGIKNYKICMCLDKMYVCYDKICVIYSKIEFTTNITHIT